MMEDFLEEGQQPHAKQTRRSLTAAERRAKAARRLEEKRLWMARKRSLELEDEAASRRGKVQQRVAERRSQEMAEQPTAKRERNQHRTAERPSQKTAEQGAARRKRDQQRIAERRSQGMAEQGAARRERDQQQIAERGSQETAEHAAARREKDQQRTAEGRSEETTAQSDARRARGQERPVFLFSTYRPHVFPGAELRDRRQSGVRATRSRLTPRFLVRGSSTKRGRSLKLRRQVSSSQRPYPKIRSPECPEPWTSVFLRYVSFGNDSER